MKEIKLKKFIEFQNKMEISVIDFPKGREDGTERQRCRITADFAEYDIKQLKSRGLDFDGAMDYYRDWIYNTVKINLAQDWECVCGYDEVINSIAEHVKVYY